MRPMQARPAPNKTSQRTDAAALGALCQLRYRAPLGAGRQPDRQVPPARVPPDALRGGHHHHRNQMFLENANKVSRAEFVAFDKDVKTTSQASSRTGRFPTSSSSWTSSRKARSACSTYTSTTESRLTKMPHNFNALDMLNSIQTDDPQEPHQRLRLPPQRLHVQAQEVLHLPRCLQARGLGHRECPRLNAKSA